MGFIDLVSFNSLCRSIGENVALILAIGVGAMAYVILIRFMKIPEVDRGIETMKRKVKVRIEERKEERE